MVFPSSLTLCLTFASCISNSSYEQIASLHREAIEARKALSFIEPIEHGKYAILMGDLNSFGLVKNPFTEVISMKYTTWLSCAPLTEVRAVCDADLVKTGWDERRVLPLVVIKSGDFTFEYLRVKATDGLKSGDKVKRGDIIGTTEVGSDSRGPRLSLGVLYKGVFLDGSLILPLSNGNSEEEPESD